MSDPDPYRRVAVVYDRVVDPMLTGVRRVALEVVPPEPGWEVVDIGCGTGTGLIRYLDAGCAVSGVDVSSAMLAKARARLGRRADLHLLDRGDLPFDDDRFDMATTTMVLHEVAVEKRAGLLAEMARVVKPNGRLLVIDFRFGSQRGWRGPTFSTLGAFVERFSGHYSGYGSFKSSGGVPTVVADAGLTVAREKIVAGGALGIYVVTAARGPTVES
jgi:ubiquinone/menaquinone biosynthesis C-methylase UbiE